MKKFLALVAMFLLTIGSANAQAIVNMNLKQNPVFGVSTNDVSATLEGQPLTLGAEVVITGGSGVYTYCWYMGSTVVGTSATLEVTEPGEYTLDVKDQCDCLQTVKFHIAGTSDISEIALGAVKQTVVFTTDGRLVKVAEGNAIATLPRGQYIVKMVDAEGRVVSKKITK